MLIVSIRGNWLAEVAEGDNDYSTVYSITSYMRNNHLGGSHLLDFEAFKCYTRKLKVSTWYIYRCGYRSGRKSLISVAPTGNKLVPSPNPNP